MNIDELSVNTIRMLALDTVQKAKSGHPGLPLGAATMGYVLFHRIMKCNPRDPFWPDRDRFVLSAGHGSALLYSLLYLTGYEKMTLDDLKSFRQWGSCTPGHPEVDLARGIETTTGPLGQGFATGVGMAIAERHLAAIFNRPEYELVDHYTYALAGDGDLMEGVVAEAASLAGHLQLGKLIYLYDNNHICLSSETGMTFTEDVEKRFGSYGWQVLTVVEGNDVDAIEKAILVAKSDASRPSLIMVSTHIGYGSPKQDCFEVHGSPLKEEEAIETKKRFGWPSDQTFFVPDEVLNHMRQVIDTGEAKEKEWKALLVSYAQIYPELMKQWDLMMGTKLPADWDQEVPVYPADPKGIATRVAGGQILNAIAKYVPSLMGGSADLDPSTNTVIKGKGSFQPPVPGGETMQGAVAGPFGYNGVNIAFGVREHAMGSIMNGLGLHGGFIPFGSTFLVFSDYIRPAIRLAALSGIQVIYVFTHDSVGLGEDGPTHQPVEQVASLRAIPHLTVIRPCDGNETAEAWKVAVEQTGSPVALILSRQNLPVIDRSQFAPAEGLRQGAYILADCPSGRPELILMASGSEVILALEACEKLTGEGFAVRVVSMPSWELFESQPEEYRRAVFPPEVTHRLAIESGVTQGWHKYVGSRGDVLGIDRFGASAPGKVVLEKFGFTVQNVMERARALIQNR